LSSESSPLIKGRIPYIAAIEALAASQDDAIPRTGQSAAEIGTCDQKLAHQTPVNVLKVGDGYVLAVTYSLDTDSTKNVLAVAAASSGPAARPSN
jgi:hypothetical protein